jgi:AcrR family transcriptional regulator
MKAAAKKPLAKRRPTAAERRSRILRAAADVFFEHGFAATSVDMIIARTGGSKRAIYNEFGSKEALFTALVAELADDALSSLLTANGLAQGDLKARLLLFARGLAGIYASRELVGVYRAIVTEAYRFPHLARAFYDRGPGRAARELQTLLDAAADAGEIAPLDTAMAADHFVGMLRDNLHLQIVLGLRGPPDQAELQRRANAAVELFLKGIASDDEEDQARTGDRAHRSRRR